MLLMLVDHTREFFFLHAQVTDPVDVTTTAPALFFTRLCAHLCAPVFVALTGLSAWLYFQKQGSLQKTSDFLLKRGLILILLELTVISVGWMMKFPPNTLYLQVIWAIGLSMIALSFLIRLPSAWLITLGLIITLGHNLLDPITFEPNTFLHTAWAIFHERSFIHVTDFFKIRTSYPVLPWIGVMSLGFAMGPWFSKNVNPLKRQKLLLIGSALSFGSFLILRFINIYGDKYPWKIYDSSMQTIISFLNLTKYPPSADFLLFTIGIGLFVMWIFEIRSGKINLILSTFGAVPMFYYVFHIYVLNFINTFLKLSFGPNQGEYFSVPGVECVWAISIVLALPFYFVCKWYAGIKKQHPNSLLKYL